MFYPHAVSLASTRRLVDNQTGSLQSASMLVVFAFRQSETPSETNAYLSSEIEKHAGCFEERMFYGEPAVLANFTKLEAWQNYLTFFPQHYKIFRKPKSLSISSVPDQNTLLLPSKFCLYDVRLLVSSLSFACMTFVY